MSNTTELVAYPHYVKLFESRPQKSRSGVDIPQSPSLCLPRESHTADYYGQKVEIQNPNIKTPKP